MKKLLLTLVAIAVAGALAGDAEANHRRWFVQTSDNKIIGFADDPGGHVPDGSIAVFEETIRAADPPGATGDILPLGTWDGTTYTAPSGGGIVVHVDPTTARGGVQEACADMLDVFDVALDYIHENRLAWQYEARSAARDGIHWQLVNAARVALNSTRTHARRQKFCEESASWPDGTNGDVRQYVDAIAEDGSIATKDWSWVDPEADPFTRSNVNDAAQEFMNATNVENAPGSATLIGRAWLRDIP